MRLQLSEMLAPAPNYVKIFGFPRGLALFATIHGPFRQQGRQFVVRAGVRLIRLRNTASDKSIFFQVVVKQEYETRGWPAQHARLARAYEELVRQGKTPIIIDAGANIGLASLWFAERYPRARLYAVEPDEGNLSLIRCNVAAVPNIVVLPGAVWDRAGNLRIANPDAGAGAFRVVEGAGNVRGYTIPEIVALEPNGVLFIVKIDIEGGESGLFRSNTGWTKDARLIVIELHDWLFPMEATSRNFLRCIAELPVDLLFGGENAFCFNFGESGQATDSRGVDPA
jgi:FkbM family methyltransferase